MNCNFCGCGLVADERDLPALEAGGLYVAERKYDGMWLEARPTEGGYEFYSRSGRRLPKVSFEIPAQLYGSHLIGEYIYGTQWAKKSLRKGRFFVFDALHLEINGRDYGVQRSTSYAERRRALELAFAAAMIGDHEAVQLVENSERLAAFYKRVLTEGGEGIVIKRRDSAYTASYTDCWIKCKPCLTYDCVATGGAIDYDRSTLTMTLAQYYPDGSLRDHTMVCLPMKLRLAHEILVAFSRSSICAEKSLVVEVAGLGQFESGAIRNPRIIRVRDDKEECDCIFNGG